LKTTDVIIVGGGPAGSSCAWKLGREGVDCLILDRETFPRTKLCAGWITPEVVTDLEIDPQRYPHSFLTFHKLRIHLRGFGLTLNTVEYSIRRYEFDHWLLQRSGAPVITHCVHDILREDGDYVIDGQFRCKYLVGAGGTRCPVYRQFFRNVNPREKDLQVVALEQEFAYPWRNGECHLWFFHKGLPGYSWYVPKADGYLNIGIGGSADDLKRSSDNIRSHWEHVPRTLKNGAFVSDYTFAPQGYSYYLRGSRDIEPFENAFVVGDSAGLATRDLGEGIGPAVRSGLRAAEAILGKRDFSLDDVDMFSLPSMLPRIPSLLARKLLEFKTTKGRQRDRPEASIQIKSI